jgi:two-component system chemotaxis sensor kinase CheA
VAGGEYMFSQEEIEVFFDELDEKLDIISQGLLTLEKEGTEAETVDEIFRAAHTIKGSSGVMGFEGMAHLTHQMENILDQLRQGYLKVNSGLITLLFESLDMLKTLQDELKNGVEQSDVNYLVQKLHNFSKSLTDSQKNVRQREDITNDFWALTSDEIDKVKKEQLMGVYPYAVYVKFAPDCAMKSVRALILLDSLAGVGDLLRSSPEKELLNEEEFEGDNLQAILLSHNNEETIEKIIDTVPEIASFRVKVIGEGLNHSFFAEIEDREELVKIEDIENTKKPDKSLPDTKEGFPQEKFGKSISHTVRVDIRKLDTLMNLIGELVIDRTRLTRLHAGFEKKYGAVGEIGVLREISTHLARVTTELQEEIMKTRMLPISQIFNRFPRLVRDLSQRFNKEIKLFIEGKETELDRTLIEAITDPLIHLVRNSVDHGIELPEEREKIGKTSTGQIWLRARQEENHIIIEVEDDGKGIDEKKIKDTAVEKGIITRDRAANLTTREALSLIFLPGFSTSQSVNDISGRGVGMDVVRSQIEKINGVVEVSTELGRGTIFTVKLPLTLAIIQSLLIGNRNEVYAFPLANVLETIQATSQDIKTVKNSEVMVVRGQVLPLVRLRHLFYDEADQDDNQEVYVVIVSVDGEKTGIIVDDLIGEQEIVIKGLGEYLGKIPGFAGATILGDGKVALIIDVRGLLNDIKHVS